MDDRPRAKSDGIVTFLKAMEGEPDLGIKATEQDAVAASNVGG